MDSLLSEYLLFENLKAQLLFLLPIMINHKQWTLSGLRARLANKGVHLFEEQQNNKQCDRKDKLTINLLLHNIQIDIESILK